MRRAASGTWPTAARPPSWPDRGTSAGRAWSWVPASRRPAGPWAAPAPWSGRGRATSPRGSARPPAGAGTGRRRRRSWRPTPRAGRPGPGPGSPPAPTGRRGGVDLDEHVSVDGVGTRRPPGERVVLLPRLAEAGDAIQAERGVAELRHGRGDGRRGKASAHLVGRVHASPAGGVHPRYLSSGTTSGAISTIGFSATKVCAMT